MSSIDFEFDESALDDVDDGEKLARPRRFERPTFAFGGQRSIQLSYGRLSVSIDETQANGNGPDFARLDVGGASCGKVRVFESSRARQLSCAEGVPGKFFVGSSHATLVMVLVTPRLAKRLAVRRQRSVVVYIDGRATGLVKRLTGPASATLIRAHGAWSLAEQLASLKGCFGKTAARGGLSVCADP